MIHGYAYYYMLMMDISSDIVRGYCVKWRLHVNAANKKAMVCRGRSVEKPTFRYDGQAIEIVYEFVDEFVEFEAIEIIGRITSLHTSPE